MTRDPDLPLGGLTPADPALLVEAPLELAVAEVRFHGEQNPIGLLEGFAVRDALAAAGYEFTHFNPVREGRLAISIEQGAAPTQQLHEQVTGWQLQDDRGHLQLTVMPSALVVQTTRYERWSTSMRPLLAAALLAVEQTVAPAGVARIGLRYLDRFTDPDATDATAWHGRICEPLLGPVLHPLYGAKVIGTQQQVELSLEPAAGAVLRHGPYIDVAADGAISYLLDIDVFDNRAQRFDIDALLDTAQALNRTAFTLFQASLTTEYLHELGAEAPPNSDTDTHTDTSNDTNAEVQTGVEAVRGTQDRADSDPDGDPHSRSEGLGEETA